MTYTIVIDVDNIRAEKAFRKGLEELEEIWPQIDHKRYLILSEIDECWKKEDVEWEENMHRWKAELSDYGDKLREYYARKTRASLWFGSDGERPEMSTGARMVMHREEGFFATNRRDTLLRRTQVFDNYKSLHRRLKRMHTIASHATAPYRMTGQDVIDMAGWEDGSTVANILEEISQSG